MIPIFLKGDPLQFPHLFQLKNSQLSLRVLPASQLRICLLPEQAQQEKQVLMLIDLRQRIGWASCVLKHLGQISYQPATVFLIYCNLDQLNQAKLQYINELNLRVKLQPMHQHKLEILVEQFNQQLSYDENTVSQLSKLEISLRENRCLLLFRFKDKQVQEEQGILSLISKFESQVGRKLSFRGLNKIKENIMSH